MSNSQFDALIVGAGFAGAVMASQLARVQGKRVLIVDKRPHIGGNAYDAIDDAGVLIHPYGPHIFHTNSSEVFEFLSQFTAWRPYEHRVLSSVDGKLVPVPINLDTVNMLYNLNLEEKDIPSYFASVAEQPASIRNSEDVIVSKVGRDLYEKLFRGYTRKQWNLDPSELDASVIARIPVRTNRDDRYFGDSFQAMPLNGFTRMFENMLDHKNIHISLSTSYQDAVKSVSFEMLVFTGPIDEYYNYRFGCLPYRSLRFEHRNLPVTNFQKVGVVNYPGAEPFTRITEFKHLTGQEHLTTSVVYEYPCDVGDPYYPVPRPANAEIYKKYEALASREENVYFVGRLATYRYYNMDQVVAQALVLSSKMSGTPATGGSHVGCWRAVSVAAAGQVA